MRLHKKIVINPLVDWVLVKIYWNFISFSFTKVDLHLLSLL